MSRVPSSPRGSDVAWKFRRFGKAAVLVALIVVARLAAGQTIPQSARGGIGAMAAQILVTCTGTKPKARPCEIVVCNNGEWASGIEPAGTPCNDSNACTYNDVCDAAGTCRGTPITCAARGPCETSACNGTSICTVATRPAGAACPYSNTGNPADPPNPCENTCDGVSYWCQP